MTSYRYHSPNKTFRRTEAESCNCRCHGNASEMHHFGMSQLQCWIRNGRKEVLEAVSDLNRREGVTVILITHYMEEVVHADKVYVMDNGEVVMQGTPREIFSQVETLKEYRLDVPQVTLLAHELHKAGVDVPEGNTDYRGAG